jgi:hypothetical protein
MQSDGALRYVRRSTHALADPSPPRPRPAVTRSRGFLEVQQEEPYGDILLTRGEYL